MKTKKLYIPEETKVLLQEDMRHLREFMSRFSYGKSVKQHTVKDNIIRKQEGNTPNFLGREYLLYPLGVNIQGFGTA